MKQYLELNEVGMVAFADKAKVSRVTLRQVIAGKRWAYISVDFAVRVCRASGGVIHVEDFASETAQAPGAANDDGPRIRATGTEG